MVRSLRWILSCLSTAMVAGVPAVCAQQLTVAPAQVAISPPRFELEIGAQPTTKSFRVINLGEEPIEVQVSVANWDMDEHNNVRVIEPTEQSLDQWMIVNPLHFSIPAGQSQTVRFSIRPRVEPAPGEHRAVVYLDQILSEKSQSSGVRVRFRYGVVVYGQVGDVVRRGRLHEVSVTASQRLVTAAFDITSEGTAHARMQGRYAVWPAAAYPGAEATELAKPGEPIAEEVLATGDLPSLPVLPGTRRQLVLDLTLALAPGSYVLDLNGALEGDKIDTGVPFTVAAPEQPSP